MLCIAVPHVGVRDARFGHLFVKKHPSHKLCDRPETPSTLITQIGMYARLHAPLLVAATLVIGRGPTLDPQASEPVPIGSTEEDSVRGLRVYVGGLQDRWHDWGWCPRDLPADRPASLDMSHFGGWILAHRRLEGDFTHLRFDLKAPASFADFIAVRVDGGSGEQPWVHVGASHRIDRGDGWAQVVITMTELNPTDGPFDRLIFRAHRAISSHPVLIDNIVLLQSKTPARGDLPSLAAPASSASAYSPGGNAPSRHVALQIDCSKPTRSIHDGIYGIAFHVRHNEQLSQQWELHPHWRRWGGNATSRYNWKLGNAWNTGADWYFWNRNLSGRENFTWRDFLAENRAHSVGSALTIPLLGWVAKDTSSYAFPVDIFGPQQAAIQANGEEPADVGNGMDVNGQLLPPRAPTHTSVFAGPSFVKEWVQAIKAREIDVPDGGGVDLYFLGNEPMLWNSTHRDVHPNPTTYDEILQRTVTYGSAVRSADPDAIIAGPSVWGWVAYFYSADDHASGLRVRPDRRAHGDIPFLPWYLRKLREHQDKTGERILNTLDVHFYPQGKDVFSPRADPETGARRIRSTRSLWDPTYRDESWIDDTIRLIPRLQQLIGEYYPGLGLSIGEYNFGGERHITGALALAEALGRFGQLGVHAAFYWTVPPPGSPVAAAFQAFRNYDGHGAAFLRRSLQTTSDRHVSLFASTSPAQDAIVAIVINAHPHETVAANMFLTGCGRVARGRSFALTQDDPRLRLQQDHLTVDALGTLAHTLPPYSITVFEIAIPDGFSLAALP